MKSFLVVRQSEYSVILKNDKDEVNKLYPDNIVIVDLGDILTETKEKCQICNKPFKLGDIVIHMHDFIEGKILNITTGHSVRMEHYGSDRTSMIVHSYDICEEVKSNFSKGKELWREGMKICEDIQLKYFKKAYKSH